MPSKKTREISIEGARVHNLKNLSFKLPLNQMVVISGLSGSGKSTLAFDLLFAEGQRRFLDCMSPYAKHFANQMERPEVDQIKGLPPTVAIEQHISRGAGKSTVATVTELYHFLRLLFSKLGVQHCPKSGQPVISQTQTALQQSLTEIIQKSPSPVRLLAPAIQGKKGFHNDIARYATKHNYQELYIDGGLIETSQFQPLSRYQEHNIDYVTSKINSPKNLTELIQETLKIGKGTLRLLTPDGTIHSFSTNRISPATGRSFPELDPAHFSFNTSRGWCPTCRGYGTVPKKGGTRKAPKDEQSSLAEAEFNEELKVEKNKDLQLIFCPTCQGARLNEIARHVKLTNLTLPEITSQTVSEALKTLSSLQFEKREELIARDILPEIKQRLEFLSQIGLSYLKLDRSADTLSGGESQRIRLAAQLGSNLRGVLYVLDEPTIGLHPRDNQKLLDTLETLLKKGNSLLIVEHDEDTILRANHLLDLGPAAGINGGTITYQGSPTPKKEIKNSPTIQALHNPLKHPLRGERRPIPAKNTAKSWLHLKQCNHNNLKNLNLHIPLGRLTVLTGISGCGKSSLLRGCLLPAALHATSPKNNPLPQTKPYASATGLDNIKAVYEIDQAPIGKTSRSCPATYVKIFDDIRKIFAQLPEARIKGFNAGRFSFNNATGQCPTCKGNGQLKLEMDFLPTSWSTCPSCQGQRYNSSTLEVYYQGLNISQVLNLNISEATDLFKNHSRLHRILTLLSQTGLGYLQLGQASPTLSGGESQRLKLATELAKGRGGSPRNNHKKSNLYLIEEPTIGLHLQDVTLLIDLLHRLVDEGHTVVVIEHHMNLAAEADYIIDLGPEAGEHGGQIIAQGTPEQVSKIKTSRTAPFLKPLL